MAEEHYLGNPLLKKANTEVELTQEQLIELARCNVDPVYFAKNYMKIVTLDHGLQPFDMYPFQERMINSFQTNRFNIVLCSRQAGKSTTVVSYLLHYAIFNNNVNIAVLANKASTARDLLGRLQTGYENLPKWIQQGILSWNKGSLELENGSKIFAASTSASSVRGGTYNVIFLDEFAFVPSQVADNFMSSVYPTITSGKESKVIIVSCVTKDTYLLTDKGYRRIETLIDKDKTGAYITPNYTVRGNDKFYSSNIVVNQGKVPTNIIKTRYETVECSEAHFLWSFKNGKYDYVRSRDLSVGDYVAIKYNQQIFGNDDYVGFNPKKGKSHNLFSCDYVNPDIAYFIGLYVSEGYARNIYNDQNVLKGGQIVITCGDDISESLSKLGVGFSKADDFHYIINSKQLIEFISELGFDVTKKAKEKILSDKVLSWSKENITALLRGMFDGDGCIDTRGRVTYASSSRELIRQVQLLLANLGILGSIYTNTVKPTKRVKVTSIVHTIEITGAYVTKYFDEIGFSLKRKADRRNFLTISSRMGCNTDIIPDSYGIIKKESGIVGRGKKFKNYSRKFLLENKEKFYENANDELRKFLDDNVSENLIWLKIKSIEKSENEVFDVSLPDVEGDKWAHSVLYNNFLGHQTPYGMNHFYKMWDDAIKQKNKYIPMRVYWHDIPGRDLKFKEETIANIGETKWNAEFECDFLGSSDTLISGAKLSNLVSEAPIRTHDLLDVYEEPQPGKTYVITVDVAEGVELDYSAFVVFDTTQIPYRIVAKYRNNDIPSLRFPDVIEPVGRAYNDAFILCEVNNDSQVAYILHTEYGYPNVIQTKTLGRGGQVAGQNLAGKGVKYGIKMSKPVKRTGCLNLKTIIEEDKLIIRDRDIIGELTTFVSRYNSFGAEEGKNDDLTMCLHRTATVVTEDGNKTIKWIVDTKYSGKVLSIDSEGKFVWSNVIGHKVTKFRNSNKEWITLKGKSNNTLPCTSDHKVAYIEDVFDPKICYIRADEMMGKYNVCLPGQRFHKTNPLYNKEQLSAIIGSLLGDSSLSKKGKLITAHSEAQKEYAIHKHSVFKGNLREVPPRGRSKTSYYVDAFTNGQTVRLRELMYPDNKKVVKNIVDFIDEISLAYWYMDDGYLKSNSALLCTDSFSYEEHCLLKEMLWEKFKIEAEIKKSIDCRSKREYYRIFIGKNHRDRFFTLIAPFVIESMNYKLPEKFKGIPKKQLNVECLDFGAEKIVSIQSLKRKGAESNLYDITVENTHNFVSNGMVVHNCLVLLAWICTQEYFKEMTETDIRKQIREEHEKQIEENDSTPFGFISSVDADPKVETDAEGNIWFTSNDDEDYSYFWNYNF